jgi:signal transduction histidine kinase
VNKACTDLLGWSEEELSGKNYGDVLLRQDEAGSTLVTTADILAWITANEEIATSSTPIDATKLTEPVIDNHRILPPFMFSRKDQTRFFASSLISPIAVNGVVIGAVEVFRDTSIEHEINKSKTEFVSIASHQLRTPLGITKWYLEALKKDAYVQAAPDNLKSYFDELYKNNERVLFLVRDLLTVSRIDQGRSKDNPQSTEVLTLIQNIVNEMTILASQQKIVLTLEQKSSSPLNMFIDPTRLHEAVGNLISNALEFTPADGRVSVTTCVENGSFQIAVSDTGIGISEEDQKKLFTKFTRLEKGIAFSPSGTGLGLYVVKSYVDAWKGRVTIQSKEGAGSTFTISIPINPSETNHQESP